jgi:hypothetical protein
MPILRPVTLPELQRFPAGTSVLLPAGSPATAGPRTPLRAVPAPVSSRETPRSTPAEARKADRQLAAVLGVSDEAGWAYADLNHALLLAGERGQEVPCQGRGGAAWTSDDYEDQQTAADRCLDCPAMLLCERYRAVAKPAGGTWAGVTSDPARKPSGSTPRRTVRPVVGDRPGCLCGCGDQPKQARYLPGHDSAHLGALLDGVRSGRLSLDGALAELAHSERLQAKLARYLGGR